MSQCGVFRGVPEHDPVPGSGKGTAMVGMEGLRLLCEASDTINSVLISKAESLFITDDKRYEALVSIYALKDSLIYMSAVNSGFEIIRVLVDKDTIRVIDRINKIVYSSAIKKKLGHQNPVNFSDLQNLVSRYYLCDDMNAARELNFNHIGFYFTEPYLNKSIILGRETLMMDKFEFVHTETNKYFLGERGVDDFSIYSNFMVNEFEIVSKGGSVSYNQKVDVKMKVNRRKYTFVSF